MVLESLLDLSSVRQYLSRVGAEPRSLRVAVVKEPRGNYWRDVATIKFAKDGTVDVSDVRYSPTDAESESIKREFASVRWPQLKLLSRIIDPPDAIKQAAAKDIFEFRNSEGLIVMVQVRRDDKKTGQKRYVPYTYWDDERWRAAEPEGQLPLWGVENIKDNTTAFIHEGAKAARAIHDLVNGPRERLEAHPWGRELANAVHLGWVGGALSPHRTDWGALRTSGIKRAYIVADNDEPGRAAVPAIAMQLRVPTFMIQFTDEFPSSFDLADEFPTKMFSTDEGPKIYIGPAFRDCLHPATWATDLMPNPKGRPSPILRDSFKGMWSYIEEADVFVCTEMPEIIRTETILNKMLAPFSHTAETTRLILKSYQGRSARICYRPDDTGLMVTFRGSSAINLHVPTVIRSQPGDPGPFIEFLEYMFVNQAERHQVMRWCATIIARPDLRIGYGLLLVSERQGIGKTTLGASIMAPLVGNNNVGFPSETDIMGSFNDWMANKRLIVVNEIYSGASWKAYHALKSVITDREVSVNQKYMRPYTIENWCHVIACSNSMRALKMENDDRRWFYPEVSEVPWPGEKFKKFRSWLERGGLNIIKHWAENFGDYVLPSERAPMTERKAEMIEGSRSEAQREAAAIAEAVKDEPEPVALLIKEVVAAVRSQVQGKVFDTDYELRKAMVDVGLTAWPKRVKLNGRLHYVLVNDKLLNQLQRVEEDEVMAMIRSHVKKPHDIIQQEM